MPNTVDHFVEFPKELIKIAQDLDPLVKGPLYEQMLAGSPDASLTATQLPYAGGNIPTKDLVKVRREQGTQGADDFMEMCDKHNWFYLQVSGIVAAYWKAYGDSLQRQH